MTEHEHQVAVFRWAAYNKKRLPELGLLHAIPNGGKRHIITAMKLKAEGVQAGVPDLCLPVPKGIHAGLYIEMKANKGRLSPEQKAWCERLMVYGHRVEVCYGWQQATQVIEDYLSTKPDIKRNDSETGQG